MDPQYWFSELGSHSNYFSIVEKDIEGQSNMVGTLPISSSGEKLKNIHYILSKNKIITLETMDEITPIFNIDLNARAEQCEDAIEGFLLLIGFSLSKYLREIYPTVKHLKMLHDRVIKASTKEHFNQLVNFKQKLVSMKNLMEPFSEIFLALKELEGDSITTNLYYQKTKAKMERISMILRRMEKENSQLLDIDDKLVQYRGNEIMKTLTVFTVLTTPITALGALWGMNFKYMPELDEKYGYLFALLLIISSSVGIYMWLKKKGWTGSILNKDDKD
ncbi:CorA family divalent cation transporter [Bacillus salacetis]|uniref:CorA family divalent cation transporter n=1 Tax=Bacillus salacetis TaxID=2315464 RepID=UPI003BA2556F